MTSDHTRSPHAHSHPPTQAEHIRPNAPVAAPVRPGVLAWSAWRRVLMVLPVLIALWLAVAWAHGGLAP